MAGFGVLAVVILWAPSNVPAVAILGFVLVMLAWPILSVSGTGLAANLTAIGEGAAMGLLAAGNAMATVLGTSLAGPLVVAVGYRVDPLVAIAGLLSAAMMMQKSRESGHVRRDDCAIGGSLTETGCNPPRFCRFARREDPDFARNQAPENVDRAPHPIDIRNDRDALPTGEMP
jgi:MFS family permease